MKNDSRREITPEDSPDKQALVVSHLERIYQQDSQILSLLRILVHPYLSSELSHIFKTSKQMRAYELSDGIRSTRDIGLLIKTHQKAVSNWWREWGKIKIAQKTGNKGQYKSSYSLFDLLVVYSRSNKIMDSKKDVHDE